MPAARPAGMTSASAPRFDPKGLRKRGNGSSPPPEAFFRMRGSVMSQRGNETVAANRRGATCDARCPAGAQRPRRTRTASITAYRINCRARNRACMRRLSGRHKWRPYGGGASGGSERAAMKLWPRNVGAPLVTPGAPMGTTFPPHPHRVNHRIPRQSLCPQPCVHASAIRAS